MQLCIHRQISYTTSTLVWLILVMPATNATSKCSFSVKTYLRSTMHQSRLNHLMLLNINKEKVDNLDIKQLQRPKKTLKFASMHMALSVFTVNSTTDCPSAADCTPIILKLCLKAFIPQLAECQ